MRTLPPYPSRIVDEFTTLTQSLDYFRAILARKLEGLDESSARRTGPAGTMTLIGLVNHIADVQLWWFCQVLDGQTRPQYSYSAEQFALDDHIDWKPAGTPAEVLKHFDRTSAAARAVVARHTLDDVVIPPGRGYECSMRWILIHMVEELARHAGHADLLREQIDGQVGN